MYIHHTKVVKTFVFRCNATLLRAQYRLFGVAGTAFKNIARGTTEAGYCLSMKLGDYFCHLVYPVIILVYHLLNDNHYLPNMAQKHIVANMIADHAISALM